MEVSWVKLKVNTFDDKKIKLILSQENGEKVIVIFFKLFCFAGEVNDNGFIYLNKNKPLTEEELAEAISIDSVTLRNAFVTLREHNIFIKHEESGHFLLCNFWKHQNVEGLDKIKTKGAERQKKYRERIKKVLKQDEPLISTDNKTVTSDVTDNVTVTSRNAIDIRDKNKSKNKIKDKSKSVTADIQSVEEIPKEQELTKERNEEKSEERSSAGKSEDDTTGNDMEIITPKKDFVQVMVEIFERAYLRNKNVPYVADAKDKKQMGMMLGKLKKIMPDANTAEMEQRAGDLFARACGITEDKFYSDITISKLNSQFNQYVNYLKNGFKQNRGRGISEGTAGKFADIERKIYAGEFGDTEQSTGGIQHTAK